MLDIILVNKIVEPAVQIKLCHATNKQTTVNGYKHIRHNATAAIYFSSFTRFKEFSRIEMNGIGIHQFAVLIPVIKLLHVNLFAFIIRPLNATTQWRIITRYR